MELIDFHFSPDLIGIVAGEKYLDLHNDYAFRSHDLSGSELRMYWGRLDESWVSSESPKNVAVHVVGVSFFDIRGSLSDCLEDLGFFGNDTLGIAEYNGLAAPEPGFEVLAFRFTGGGEIAVRGKLARVDLDLK